jgi:hypothetical protein
VGNIYVFFLHNYLFLFACDSCMSLPFLLREIPRLCMTLRNHHLSMSLIKNMAVTKATGIAIAQKKDSL